MLAQEAIFRCRIYLIFSAVAFHCLYINVSLCQEIGAYRTVASGNFGNIAIWQVYDGTNWLAATAKPSQTNNIYIDQTHLLTLTGNEEVKSLFINAEALAAQKLNLNGNNLDIYGSLQGFDGAAPGTPNRAWNSINWIGNSITSTITFKGNSRTIIMLNTWSGQSDRSRFSVVFDPGPGVELIVEEAIKALNFTIKSGSVYQKIDNSSVPSKCPTFSFNTETTIYGSGSFGDFLVESGGRLLSDCNNDIIFRSASLSANLLDLKSGAELILEGTNPRIEAANFQLDGKVTFRGGSAVKSIPSSTFSDAGTISSFNDLEIQGNRNVQMPPNLTIKGNISQLGSGSFLTGTSHITFAGNQDQIISGFPLIPLDLTVDKSGGKVNLQQNLSVLRNLSMLNGKLDFLDNELTINSSNSGTYNYSGGSWENLSTFTYSNAPTSFITSNATFPFGDRYQGGIRKVQMLGTSAGGNLTIQFTEYKGADFNPAFDDTGGIPILYRLFSYFQFSGLTPTSNPVELRISADKLIVDEPEDLRLVCTGYAAPGTHLESTDEINLWAIRSMTFDDLPGKNFTVGSFRTLSVLPVTWLSLSAKLKDTIKQITWSVVQEKDNEKFEIYSSTDPTKEWTKIGEIPSSRNSDAPVFYSFNDESTIRLIDSYYQIKQVDFSGKWSWSHVVRLESELSNSTGQLSIFPNPHSNGKIKVNLPEIFYAEKTLVSIYSTQGLLISSFSFDEFEFSEKLEILNPGLYLINFLNSENSLKTRWIKR